MKRTKPHAPRTSAPRATTAAQLAAARGGIWASWDALTATSTPPPPTTSAWISWD